MKDTINIARQFLTEQSLPVNEEDNRAFDKNGGFIEDAEQFFNLKSPWAKDIVKKLNDAGCKDHTATLVSLNKALNRALEDWRDLDDDISEYLTKND